MSTTAKNEAKNGTLHHVAMPPEERLYLSLVTCFVTLLVLTNIIGPKLFSWFGPSPFGWMETALTAGLLTYPWTFVVTDVVSEVFGKKRADRMVILGFAMSLLMLLIVQLSIAVPAHPIWGQGTGFEAMEAYYDSSGRPASDVMQDSWETVFGPGWWLVSGSMLAYLVAQLTDNYLFHFWRRLTKGKHLWLRNNLSTPVSQLFDTFIVNSFLFFGWFGMDFETGFSIMWKVYLFKLLIAWVDTPFCYLGVGAARRYLRRNGVKLYGDQNT